MKINGVNVTERQIEALRAVRDLRFGIWSTDPPAFSEPPLLRASDKAQLWLRIHERGWVESDMLRYGLSESGAAVLAEAEARRSRTVEPC